MMAMAEELLPGDDNHDNWDLYDPPDYYRDYVEQYPVVVTPAGGAALWLWTGALALLVLVVLVVGYGTCTKLFHATRKGS